MSKLNWVLADADILSYQAEGLGRFLYEVLPDLEKEEGAFDAYVTIKELDDQVSFNTFKFYIEFHPQSMLTLDEAKQVCQLHHDDNYNTMMSILSQTAAIRKGLDL
jgi:hypothetical protein